MGDSVIGVTRQCDYPAAASDIEVIGSFLIPDKKRILELSPDVVIGISSLHHHMPEALQNERTGVILFDYNSVHEILDVMEGIASLSADIDSTLAIVARLRNRVNAIPKVKFNEAPVRTLFLISEDPIVLPAHNSYQYDALRICGAKQLPNGYTQYERVTIEEVVYFDPEVILACGRHRGEPLPQMCPDCRAADPICQRTVEDIASKPYWKDTSAALNGNIFAIPCHWLCRPGPRLIEGLEKITGILHGYKHPAE
jgi:iron complex transport system substrate-binding protein